MTQDIPYYVYKITCVSTGQYYYGYRSQHVKYNRMPENDIWIRYFTSSTEIKKLIQLYTKANFVAEIIFKTNDLSQCYWYEQDLIKENIQKPLLLNKYYHDREMGHRHFRAKDINCQYCHKLIGSGNIIRHELACSSNVDRIVKKREQLPCEFCGILRGPGVKQRHESSCQQNPNRSLQYNCKAGKQNCRYCNKEFNLIGVGKHEKRCEKNLGAHVNLATCLYCKTIIPKKTRSTHLRTCTAVIKTESSAQRKLPCRFCVKLIGSCAQSRHEKACLMNPDREVTHQEVVNCDFCNKSVGAWGMSKHIKSCTENPAAIKFKSPTKQCCVCEQPIAVQVLGKHERACERKRLTCSGV